MSKTKLIEECKSLGKLCGHDVIKFIGYTKKDLYNRRKRLKTIIKLSNSIA